MTIETFTPSQIDNFKKLDTNLVVVERLAKLKARSVFDNKYLAESNKNAFEAYYDVTREIVLTEGKTEILVDREMVKVANVVLETHGFNQWWG